MNGMGNILGEICKIVLPIPEESYAGNPDSELAVCTLSSIDLLKQIASSPLMSKISVAGRLFSESRGIDSLLRYLSLHKNVKTMLVCGNEVRGHMAGHSLFCLHKTGIGPGRRIAGSASPEPFLTATTQQIAHFQDRVELVDRIGVTDLGPISAWINSRSSASPG